MKLYQKGHKAIYVSKDKTAEYRPFLTPDAGFFGDLKINGKTVKLTGPIELASGGEYEIKLVEDGVVELSGPGIKHGNI